MATPNGSVGLASSSRVPRHLELLLAAKPCRTRLRVLLDESVVARFKVRRRPRWFATSIEAEPGRSHRLRLVARPGRRCKRGRLLIADAILRERIPIGSTVAANQLNADAEHGPFMSAQLDSVTVGTNLQWLALEPRQGSLRFQGADQVVAWAQAHGLALRGHPLIWWIVPHWVVEGNYDREQLIEIMRTRITTVVDRYQGQITEWDVVNEAITAEGDYQRNVFFETIGPEYVDLAFRFAREADPNAKLYYNDYDAEVINPQSDAILRMVAGMRARGVPINGVGFQGHFFGGQPDAEAVAANLDRFADLGLEIQFTEVDMPDYSDDPSAPERRQLQADSYRTIAGVCRLEPACQRFTMWGLTDRYTWLGSETEPLPFDDQLQPKPAWDALTEELRPE